MPAVKYNPLTKSKLTVKQAKFVQEYIKSEGNGTQSALKAYNTTDEKTAGVIAVENLGKPSIQNEIQQAANRVGLSPERVLSRLNAVLEQDARTVPAAQVINDMAGWKAPQKQEITHRLGGQQEEFISKYAD